tara:strand:- start:292 stop:1017 length:726 start_codon:yes stop_codon:yes gene_type:complete
VKSISDTLIIIPARMESKRFPGKPLVNINGKTMLEHVRDRAIESGAGKVVVACCDKEIKIFLEKKNIFYIWTKKNLNSGTDRVNFAFEKIKNRGKYKYVINLQGDVPFIKYKDIIKLKTLIKNSPFKIATLISEIKNKNHVKDPNIVKAVISKYNHKYYEALYFSRSPIPYNAEKYYEHVGIYAYTKLALKKFVSLGKSNLEKQEKLEQLRALENNMRIAVQKISNAPVSIDIPEDLNRLK